MLLEVIITFWITTVKNNIPCGDKWRIQCVATPIRIRALRDLTALDKSTVKTTRHILHPFFFNVWNPLQPSTHRGLQRGLRLCMCVDLAVACTLQHSFIINSLIKKYENTYHRTSRIFPIVCAQNPCHFIQNLYKVKYSLCCYQQLIFHNITPKAKYNTLYFDSWYSLSEVSDTDHKLT